MHITVPRRLYKMHNRRALFESRCKMICVCFLSFFGAFGLNLRRCGNVFCVILLLGRGKDAEGVIAALDVAQIL